MLNFLSCNNDKGHNYVYASNIYVYLNLYLCFKHFLRVFFSNKYVFMYSPFNSLQTILFSNAV